MNILAVDTATKIANVSLSINGKVINKSVENEITHSEKLLPLIENCLKDAGVNIKDINTFCVTTGPGSFTGLRIAIATIKAFTKVMNSDIFAINNLEALAYNATKKAINNEYILSLIDAKNNRVYYALYKFEDNILKEVSKPSNDILDDAVKNVERLIDDTLNVVLEGKNIDQKKLNILKPLNIITSKVSGNTLLSIYSSYLSNKNIEINKYIYNYLNLDATYARASGAERIKNGEKC